MHDARIGVDLVDVLAFQARFMERDEQLGEVFTADELAYCRHQRHPWPHLAARFAAKEAVLKALTSGLAGAMRWHDIEVVRDPAGTPRLAITGATEQEMRCQRLAGATVSLSHTSSHAIAMVMVFAA